MSQPLKFIILPITLILSLFQIYTAGFGVLTPFLQRGIHLSLVLTLIFLLYPIHESPRLRWLDFFAVCLSVANGYYIATNYLDFANRVGAPDLADKIFATITIVLILEATRRVAGLILSGIAATSLLYVFFGYLLPGIFQITPFSLSRVVSLEYMSTSGVWGITLGVAATFVALFILFGGFLQATGAGDVFIDLAFAIAGKFRGGPAKVAVFSSALLGTVSGSAVANVSTTGTFTIPLMKKVGYAPHAAAAIEAVSSTGGQIMPPVMAAGAFIMVRLTGIPFPQIAEAAAIPAVLYFISAFLFVDFEAGRLGITGINSEDLPKMKDAAKRGLNLYCGLGTLIYLLVIAKTPPTLAAFWSIIAIVISTFVFNFRSVKWDFILRGLEYGARNMLMVTAACATAGIVVGVIRLSGIGVTFTTLIINLGGTSLFITLVISMIVCIIVGMGMPPAASYILLGVLVAPSLVKLGLPLISSHMFVYYYTSLAPITPPVALAAYAGAGIAGSDPTRTAFTALKIALVAFIIPFIFVFQPSMLAQGGVIAITTTFCTAVVGVFFLVAATSGWLRRPLNGVERVLALAGGIMLLIPGVLTDVSGVGIALIVGILVLCTSGKLQLWHR